MTTAQTRQPVIGPGSLNGPTLFCRDSATGELLWSRSRGIPAYFPANAQYRVDGTCGTISHAGGTTSLNHGIRGLFHMHSHDDYLIVVEIHPSIGHPMLPIITVWNQAGERLLTIRQRDLPGGIWNLAAARNGIVWIQRLGEQGYELWAIGKNGILSHTLGAFLLSYEHDGAVGYPMVRPDGSVYVSATGNNQGVKGVLTPDGQHLWTRNDLADGGSSWNYRVFQYPNGDLLQWVGNGLSRFNGTSGAWLANSGMGSHTYHYAGDGIYSGNSQGGNFDILPDGRLAFSEMKTERIIGVIYENLSQWFFAHDPPPLADLVSSDRGSGVYQYPTSVFGYALMYMWHWLNGIVGQNLLITEHRHSLGMSPGWLSLVGATPDQVVRYFDLISAAYNAQEPRLIWNDAGLPLLGLWHNDTEIPEPYWTPWAAIGQVDLIPSLKGAARNLALRDSSGNWYSPKLQPAKKPGEEEAEKPHIKSVDATGVERWRIELGWEADLQTEVQFTSLSADGSQVYYLM